MQQVKATSQDPAPSRWSYRMQRWMLTPGIRTGLRVGIPLGMIAIAAGVFLANEARRDAVRMFVTDVRASIQERPEFMVGLMAIDGAGTSVGQDIREAVPIDFPISSFDLDLEQIREAVTGLDPVKEASVRIRPGGILQIDVIERLPALVWRSYEGLAVLDETGAHVGELPNRTERADLPLIAGEAANVAVKEALLLFETAEPLGARLRGLLRIGERRWDVILDRGQRILLPTRNPAQALERVIALNEAQDLLERDLTVVDMRIPERTTIRMTQNAVEDWWRIRKINGIGQ